MSSVIYADRLYLPKKDIVDIAQLRQRFRFVTASKDILDTFIETNNYFAIPREYNFKYDVMALTNGAPANINIKNDLILRETQHKALNAILTNNKWGGVLHMLPGKGKTVTALYLAALFKRKTLIVVRTTDLVEQWVGAIHEYLINPSVGIVASTLKKEEWDADIIVASIDTLIRREYTIRHRRQFFLTVYDEVHHNSAPVYNQAVHFGFGYRLGLSGTPYDEGFERLYMDAIGDVIYTDIAPDLLSRYYRAQTELVPIIYRNADFNDYLDWISASNDRTKMIVDLSKKLVKQGRKILILSARVELSKILKALIPNSALLIGEIKPSERKLVRKNRELDVTIATPSIAKEAIDVVWWDTLIVATPFSKRAIQALGRVIRSYEGKTEPLFYFIEDATRKSEKHAVIIWKELINYFSSTRRIALPEYNKKEEL